MATVPTTPLVKLQRGISLSALLAALLVVYGLVRFPTALGQGGLAGALAVLIMLAAYCLVGWFGLPRTARWDPAIVPAALIGGLLISLVFAGEIALEYILLPADNTLMGTVEYGTVFGLCFLLALRVACVTRSARKGLLAAVGAQLLGSLIWYVAVLAVYYAFAGTPQQLQVFQAEGNYADYARSGGTDFAAWVMQDFLGAGFFHLLLGPLAAALFGLIGGLGSKGVARLQSLRA